MEILSYVIVIILGWASLAIASFLSLPLSLVFAWLPEKKLALVVSFFSGVCGPFISVLVSKYIFSEVGGFSTYTLEMYLAAIIPMFFPILKDFRKTRELEYTEYESEIDINSKSPSKADTLRSFPTGAILGIILTFFLLFKQV